MRTRIEIKDNQIINKENIPDNWILDIKKDRLFIVSLSNANKDKKRINSIKLENGSLFLYNNSNDWYFTFRKEELQDILDTYNVSRIVNSSDFATTREYLDSDVKPVTIEFINWVNDYEKPKYTVETSTIAENEKGSLLLIAGKVENKCFIFLDGSERVLYVQNRDVNIIKDLNWNQRTLVEVWKL